MSRVERSLEGKAALVTGSVTGVGLGVAEALAARGCNLTLSGFGDNDEIRKLCARLSHTYDVEVVYSSTDMGDPESIRRTVEAAVGCCGRVDILVNHAGLADSSLGLDTSGRALDQVLDRVWSSAFHATHYTLPGMLAAGWGRIIHIASGASPEGSPGHSPSIVAQHGLAGLTRAVAEKVKGSEVTVNTIAADEADTPTVADLAAWLCSEEGSGKNGAVLPEEKPGSKEPGK